jgi:hypothetical protein
MGLSGQLRLRPLLRPQHVRRLGGGGSGLLGRHQPATAGRRSGKSPQPDNRRLASLPTKVDLAI